MDIENFNKILLGKCKLRLGVEEQELWIEIINSIWIFEKFGFNWQ